jgi:hypothetical protein
MCIREETLALRQCDDQTDRSALDASGAGGQQGPSAAGPWCASSVRGRTGAEHPAGIVGLIVYLHRYQMQDDLVTAVVYSVF